MVAQLRHFDLSFAEASVLREIDLGRWQAAVYLLTGCPSVWRALGAAVLADRTIAPASEMLSDPRRGWSPSEEMVMAWALHFWEGRRRRPGFPYVFERFQYERWVVACHLHKGLVPARRRLTTLAIVKATDPPGRANGRLSRAALLPLR